MYISFFTDEAHADFAEALRLAKSWGVNHAEMRSVDGVNVLDMTDEQATRAKRLLDEAGMQVSAVATPFFKCSIPGRETGKGGPMHAARELSYEEHIKLLPRAVELARLFETDRIRLFSFWNTEDDSFWPQLQEAVAATLEITEGTGVIPCLENEGACCIRTGADFAEVVRRFSDDRLKLIWDPGNSTYADGKTTRPEDFEAFKTRIGLVHIKDSVFDKTANKRVPTPAGAGETGFREELARIAAVYDDALTLEPHYAPNGDMTEGMRQCVEALRGLAAELQIDLK